MNPRAEGGDHHLLLVQREQIGVFDPSGEKDVCPKCGVEVVFDSRGVVAGKQEIGGVEGGHRGTEECHHRYQEKGWSDAPPPDDEEEQRGHRHETNIREESFVVVAVHPTHPTQLFRLDSNSVIHAANLEDQPIQRHGPLRIETEASMGRSS